MQEPIKQVVDYVTVASSASVWVFTDVIMAVNLYLPPVLLLLALMWWLLRYWEKLSGRDISDTKIMRKIFRKKETTE